MTGARTYSTRRRPWPERFWEKVDKNGPIPPRCPELGPCWIWTASVQEKRGGYGQFNQDGKMRRAHRISYEIRYGECPPNRDLDHLCHVPRCVNPAHLEPVTRRENVHRGDAPCAVGIRTNRCKRGHVYTPENTIRRPSRLSRECRKCENEAQRRRTARKRAERKAAQDGT